MRRLWPCVLLVALTALAAAAPASPIGSPPCRGSALSASFDVEPGSAGAGNIVYVLRLRNASTAACSVTGLPRLLLLGRAGRPLPTHVRAAFPGALTAVLVSIPPGGYASASARFSPDVPGPGEPTAGRLCEPVATAARVTAPGGGTIVAALHPATSVCSHGSLSFSAYSAGKGAGAPPTPARPSVAALVRGRAVTIDGRDWLLSAECADVVSLSYRVGMVQRPIAAARIARPAATFHAVWRAPATLHGRVVVAASQRCVTAATGAHMFVAWVAVTLS